MSESVEKKKALKTLMKIMDKDPMVVISYGKESVRLDRHVSPLMMVSTEVQMHADGFIIDTHYGIVVKPECRTKVLDVVNKLNGENVRGHFLITKDGTLSHRNYCQCGKEVQMDALQCEVSQGTKAFFNDLCEIMEAVGSEEEKDEEYEIV